jgi:hypothetical protein
MVVLAEDWKLNFPKVCFYSGINLLVIASTTIETRISTRIAKDKK